MMAKAYDSQQFHVSRNGLALLVAYPTTTLLDSVIYSGMVSYICGEDLVPIG